MLDPALLQLFKTVFLFEKVFGGVVQNFSKALKMNPISKALN